MYLLKRCLDLSFAVVALIALSPIMLLVVLAIRLDSSGPALFKQQRITKDGRVFLMYKFRTMIEHAERMHTGLFSYADDFRVTRVGRFLRKTSLDELPQLINVILGDMSIVGPRPPVSYELGDYNGLSPRYKKRFSVLGGITGLAQCSGRNELTWDGKIQYDNLYVDLFEKYGVLVDLKIMLLTIWSVLHSKGIVEAKDSSFDGCSGDEIAAQTASTILEKARERHEG